MSDLHERLLAWVGPKSSDEGMGTWGAVRAAVELHKPIEHRAFGTLCGECSHLESGAGVDDVLLFVAEPCNTIWAIAEALGIGETPK